MQQQNCYRLLRLVNNLIDITKIDSGYFELKFSRCNIVEVVENITLLVVEYAKTKGSPSYLTPMWKKRSFPATRMQWSE